MDVAEIRPCLPCGQHDGPRIESSMRDQLNAYNRELYRKSLKYRLARINATRRRAGLPQASSLDEVKLYPLATRYGPRQC